MKKLLRHPVFPIVQLGNQIQNLYNASVESEYCENI